MQQGFTPNYELKQYFVYLDRLNGPAEILRLLKILAQSVDRRYCYKVIYVIPKMMEPLVVRKSSYWFGMESIAACLAANTRVAKDKIAQLFELGQQLRIFSTRT